MIVDDGVDVVASLVDRPMNHALAVGCPSARIERPAVLLEPDQVGVLDELRGT